MLVTGRPFHLDFDDKYHPVDVEHQRAHVETCLYVTQRFSMNKDKDWLPLAHYIERFARTLETSRNSALPPKYTGVGGKNNALCRGIANVSLEYPVDFIVYARHMRLNQLHGSRPYCGL